MSSLPVAARAGSPLPRIPVWLVAVALIVAVGVGMVVGANAFATANGSGAAKTRVTHHNVFPAAPSSAFKPTSPMAVYSQVVSNLAAAESRHDFAGIARFRSQLDRVLTPEMIGTLYLKHQRLSAMLGASEPNQRTALINRELHDMCSSDGVKAVLDFCN